MVWLLYIQQSGEWVEKKRRGRRGWRHVEVVERANHLNCVLIEDAINHSNLKRSKEQQCSPSGTPHRRTRIGVQFHSTVALKQHAPQDDLGKALVLSNDSAQKSQSSRKWIAWTIYCRDQSVVPSKWQQLHHPQNSQPSWCPAQQGCSKTDSLSALYLLS